MKQRINPYEQANVVKALTSGLGVHLAKSPVEKSLMELVCYRISQINGCAYCLDMHSKDLRAAGETEQRLYVISAWREAPFYSERERAALAWAEAVNALEGNEVPDDAYEEALTQFTEQELVDITLGVLAVSNFNRMNVAFRMPAGSYEPGKHAVAVH